VISGTDALLLVGAGALAGAVGTAGGITSLISYPALLAVGVGALPANIVNIVALVACWPGSALASRPELRGKAPWIARWSIVSAAGGAAGSGLLLSTTPGVFEKIVPFLVMAGALALLFQPRVSAWRERHMTHRSNLWLMCGLVPMSVYNGYFGAGAGVMVLALVLLTVNKSMSTANALKNMLLGAAAVVSAAIFIAFGHVDWDAVLPLGAGMFCGSTAGPWLARRIPENVLRWLVALVGIGLAIRLWVAPI
jgi:uncharacterized protein